MWEVRLQDVIGRVESGTETESEAGARAENTEKKINVTNKILGDLLSSFS